MYQKHGEFVPVIIYSKTCVNDIRDCIIKNYGKIKYELPFINAVSVEIPQEKIPTVSSNKMIDLVSNDAIVSKSPISPGIMKVTRPDGFSRRPGPQLFESERDRLVMGRGVGVAVIDTGIAPHYDLIKPYNRIIAFKDFVGEKSDPYDDDGHGTHVAGIVAGNGYTTGKYIGTSPCCNIISIKALDHAGNGTESDILAALQWVIHHRRMFNIRVINLSLGVKAEGSYEKDSLVRGANAAVHHGFTVVTAAGNNGPGESTINSPGISPLVITVGAADLSRCDKTDGICVAKFSSRGPTLNGIIKPDIIAPGVDIISLDAKNPKNYVSQSGTSMAAPVVSGVAANLHAMYPRLTPAQVKQFIIQNALPIEKENRNAQGCGFLNYKTFINLQG
ncbi:MAG: S8 family peptidase [Anaerovoracaceae bacterium]|jgi:serine protease AprX